MARHAAQLAHGLPPAFPARPAGRGQRPGQRDAAAVAVPRRGRRRRADARRRRRDRAQLPVAAPGRADHRRLAGGQCHPAGRPALRLRRGLADAGGLRDLAPSARAALVARDRRAPRVGALRLRQQHDRRQYGRRGRALPRRLPVFPARGPQRRIHQCRAARRRGLAPRRRARRLPLLRARVPRAGDHRAVPPAAPAVGRGPRPGTRRRGRARPALARRVGRHRPRGLDHGQGRRDPARLRGLHGQRRQHAPPRPRVRARLALRGALDPGGDRHGRPARVPVHGGRRAGRADHRRQ